MHQELPWWRVQKVEDSGGPNVLKYLRTIGYYKGRLKDVERVVRDSRLFHKSRLRTPILPLTTRRGIGNLVTRVEVVVDNI